MNRKNLFFVVIGIFVIFALSGCETVPKKFRQEVLGIKTRVDTLETKVDSVEGKQVEVERMTSQQTQAIEDLKQSAREKMSRTRSNVSVKPRGKHKEGIRQIQTCLKNAGFYNGKVDGVKGKATKKAIKEFQAANGLKADGRVGPKTWEALNRYSSGAAAQDAGGTEEGAGK